jgi:hypothetical protein
MKRTMTKRFYKTSSAVNYPPILKLLSEAIEDAKSELEAKPSSEFIYIVEVVRVVRRERNPIIVEEIRK